MAKQKKKAARSAKEPKRRTEAPKKRITPVTLAKGIVYKSPKELKGYANNAKSHSLEQIELIAESIKKFGFNAPMLIDGSNTVIAGHGRLAAALKLGLPHVPVIVLDHMSEEERKAYIIADNKLGEVGVTWDNDFLARELAALDSNGFDLESLGFSDDELEDLLPDLEEEADQILEENPEEDDGEGEEAPAPREPQATSGATVADTLDKPKADAEPVDSDAAYIRDQKKTEESIPVQKIPAGISGKSSEAEKELIEAYDECNGASHFVGGEYGRFRMAMEAWRNSCGKV